MDKQLIYVANWKMYLSYQQICAFLNNYGQGLKSLGQNNNKKIVLCPPMVAVDHVSQYFSSSTISIGAQDCSDHERGAFTGQTDAQSLQALGCLYSIVGHSERRLYNGDSDNIICNKVKYLIDQKITPIICIGETIDQKTKNLTFNTLKQQLELIFSLLQTQKIDPQMSIEIYIAYEPIWAIGTGLIPEVESLNEIFSWLKSLTQAQAKNIQWRLLYGGSVTSKTIVLLHDVKYLDGFLVGAASLDFQEFEKIVNYTSMEE